MVNVTGILALETAPGLNRHRRKALTAELSRIGLPRLWAIVASVTLPTIEPNSTWALAGLWMSASRTASVKIPESTGFDRDNDRTADMVSPFF